MRSEPQRGQIGLISVIYSKNSEKKIRYLDLAIVVYHYIFTTTLESTRDAPMAIDYCFLRLGGLSIFYIGHFGDAPQSATARYWHFQKRAGLSSA
ncbi:MAG: hypothetical protein ACRCZS_07295 [Chroococcidiopsis sp.]